MKYTVTLFSLSILLAGCGRHLSDAEISQKAVGVWTMPHTTAKMEVQSDGSYFTRSDTSTDSGSWHVEDGCIVALVTNMSDHASASLGQKPSRYKVISIDEHQMTFTDGTTNLVTFTKP